MRLKLTCKSCRRNIEIEGEGHVAAIECPNCGIVINLPSNILDIDSELGGFKVIRHLGSGSMGCVYLAKQMSMDRDVAIKVLPPAVKEHEGELQNFLKEVRLLAKLDHPNIVTAFEAGESGGNYYMAMTYVQGETLEDKIVREGPLEEVEALNVARKVAEALRYAWDKHHILHRDVKPENIMVDERNSEPKLLDMGISKAINEETETSSEYGILVGTPHYMSPEQASTGHNIDFRSDMYSLGCSLFHFVTGNVPYDDTNVMQVLSKHALDPVPSPLKYNPKLHPETVDLLRRIMAKDPNDRFDSWDALLIQIRKIIHDIKLGKGKRIKAGKRQPVSTDVDAAIKADNVMARMHEEEFREATPETKLVMRLLIVVVSLLICATLAFAYVKHRRSPTPEKVSNETVSPDVQNKIDAARRKLEEKRAVNQRERESNSEAIKKAFHQMIAAETATPSSYDPLIKRCRDFMPRARGTEVEPLLTAHINNLIDRQKSEPVTVMRNLKRLAAGKLKTRNYDDAVNLYKNYTGHCAAETAGERNALVKQLRKQQARDMSTKEGAKLFVEQAASYINNGLYKKAIDLAEKARINGDLDAALIQFVREVSSLDEVVAHSFQDQVGTEVTVNLRKAKATLSITAINGDEIKAYKTIKLGGSTGRVPRNFKISELHSSERLKRLTSIKGDVLKMMKGIIALELKKYSSAKTQFKKVDAPLAQSLLFYTEVRSGDADEWAEVGFKLLLKMLRIKRGPLVEMNRELNRRTFTSVEKLKMKTHLDIFMLRFGKSRTAKDNSNFLYQLMDMLGTTKPIDKTKAKELLNEIKRVNRLKKLISTLKPVVGGVHLDLSKNPGLTQILPSSSIKVRELSLSETAFEDIHQLAKFKLRSLDLSRTPVKSLKRFKNYSLVHLNLSGTKVRKLPDMERYRAMSSLNLSGTPVESLKPLIGASIEELDIRNCSGLNDLIVLRQLPNLKRLYVSPELRNLWSLSSMRHLQHVGWSRDNLMTAKRFWKAYGEKACQKLRQAYDPRLKGILQSIADRNNLIHPVELMLKRCKYHPDGISFNFNGVNALKDISDLRGIPVVSLSIANTRIRDLSPLHDAPLKYLTARGTQITTLADLKKCPLEVIDTRGTKVDPTPLINAWPGLKELLFSSSSLSSLDMLKGKLLTKLYISGGSFVTLEPLTGMPLVSLRLDNVPINDLSPLADIRSLHNLSVPNTGVTSVAPLRNLTLNSIDVSNCDLTDLSPLKNSPLKQVWITNTKVKNLDFLAGNKLLCLEAAGAPISDITVLSNMPIETLKLGKTNLSNFEAIRSMNRLIKLWINDTEFYDLDLLTGKPLQELRLDGCHKILSLKPVESLQSLRRLTVPANATDRRVLKRLPHLTHVDSKFNWWKTTREMFLQ